MKMTENGEHIKQWNVTEGESIKRYSITSIGSLPALKIRDQKEN
jgi:3-deoxy-D-manno-octulosonate 8-phosphate phosphatase KdsC-like HAD superfamily phosphatase